VGIKPQGFETNFHKDKIRTNDEIRTEYFQRIGMNPNKNKKKSKPIPIPMKNNYIQ
jgi:hypothetical protein